jgi:hypothetical protein
MAIMPEMFTHKKFQAGISTAVAVFLGQFFPAYSEAGEIVLALASVDWLVVVTPIVAAILAQGAADFGKEKAITEGAIRSIEQEQEHE